MVFWGRAPLWTSGCPLRRVRGRLRLGELSKTGTKKGEGQAKTGALSKTGTKKGEGLAKTGGTFKDWD